MPGVRTRSCIRLGLSLLLGLELILAFMGNGGARFIYRSWLDLVLSLGLHLVLMLGLWQGVRLGFGFRVGLGYCFHNA